MGNHPNTSKYSESNIGGVLLSQRDTVPSSGDSDVCFKLGSRNHILQTNKLGGYMTEHKGRLESKQKVAIQNLIPIKVEKRLEQPSYQKTSTQLQKDSQDDSADEEDNDPIELVGQHEKPLSREVLIGKKAISQYDDRFFNNVFPS
jgi:hypothetical protein